MTLNETDPANQFEWLESILSTSQQNKEKVDPRHKIYQGIKGAKCVYLLT